MIEQLPHRTLIVLVFSVQFDGWCGLRLFIYLIHVHIFGIGSCGTSNRSASFDRFGSGIDCVGWQAKEGRKVFRLDYDFSTFHIHTFTARKPPSDKNMFGVLLSTTVSVHCFDPTCETNQWTTLNLGGSGVTTT